MRVFTVHRTLREVRLVPDGLSVWALLFGPLWLFWHRAWLAGLAVLLAALLLDWAARGHAGEAFGTVARALEFTLDASLLLFGNDLRRLELRLGGWRHVDRVAGAGADHALLRVLDRADRAAATGRR